jgi:hypothetical protein
MVMGWGLVAGWQGCRSDHDRTRVVAEGGRFDGDDPAVMNPRVTEVAILKGVQDLGLQIGELHACRPMSAPAR